MAVSAIAALSWLLYSRQDENVLALAGRLLPDTMVNMTLGGVGLSVLGAVAMAIATMVLNRLLGQKYAGGVLKVVQWRDTVRSVLIGIGMATVGFLIARVHLRVFDKWYLRYGSIRTLETERH